jgi:hypothetical protein
MTRSEKTFACLIVAITVAEVAKRAIRADAAALGLTALQVAAIAGVVSTIFA